MWSKVTINIPLSDTKQQKIRNISVTSAHTGKAKGWI